MDLLEGVFEDLAGSVGDGEPVELQRVILKLRVILIIQTKLKDAGVLQ